MDTFCQTRAEAKLVNEKRYNTGQPCKHGHLADRWASTGTCLECVKNNHKAWCNDNPDKALANTLKWQKENRDRLSEYNKARRRKWLEDNPLIKAEREAYAEDVRRRKVAAARLKAEKQALMKARRSARIRRNRAAWRKANPDKLAAEKAKRRATKLQATPPWYDHKAVTAIYAEAQRLTEVTGIEFHVDHIDPLLNPDVCGLHTVDNLQILTAADNLAKGNSFVV